MSTFHDWVLKELANIESGFKSWITAMAPDVKAVALQAVANGVAAVTTTDGTIGDKLVAARNAVETTAKASVQPLETDALHQAVILAVAANPGLLGAPAKAAP